MSDEMHDRIRDAVMDLFREWGGQWNVSAQPPEPGAGTADRWQLRVHSRPVARGELSTDVIEAYLAEPSDPEASARWEEALRPLFERAKAASDL
jgi:hypothetical protein